MKKVSDTQFQSDVSPFVKFTSISGPVLVWKRKDELPISKPDWPPSPKIVCTHFSIFEVTSQVPLSCVPPCRSFTLNGFTDRLWNCNVVNPLLMLVSLVGTRESSCWQQVSTAPDNDLDAQFAEISVTCPLERIVPPSEDSQN